MLYTMFLVSAFLLLMVLHHNGVNGELNCTWVATLDCTHYTPHVMCGNNGRDYPNRCVFAKAQCADSSLHTLGEGTCSHLGYTIKAQTTKVPLANTPTNPSTAATKGDPLHVICDTMIYVHCVKDVEPVCGSDDRTYINTCEFHKEVCKRHNLTVKHMGFC